MKDLFSSGKQTWIWRCLPAFVVMIIIFIHSAMPAEISSQESSFLEAIAMRLFRLDADTASFFVRKSAHFTEYLVLGISMLYAVEGWKLTKHLSVAARFLRRGLPAWGLGTLYAVTDEIHQSFVPGRSCEFRDVCIDAAGVMTGIWILLLIQMIRRRKKSEKTS